MATIGTVGVATVPSSGRPSGAPASSSGELAKLTRQLSDWVNCPSSKTSAGKTKIAEISGKIDAIKAKAQRAETDQSRSIESATRNESAAKSTQGFRMDGVGNRLNVQA